MLSLRLIPAFMATLECTQRLVHYLLKYAEEKNCGVMLDSALAAFAFCLNTAALTPLILITTVMALTCFVNRLLSDYRARHSSNQEYPPAGSTEKPGAVIRNQTADALFNETQAHKY